MNFIKNILLASTLILLFSIKSNAQLLKIEIRATGLTCSMCSNAIFKQLQSIAGVDSLQTDLNTNTFIVILKKKNNLTPKIFKERVEKAGFFVGLFIVTAMPQTINQQNYVSLNDKPINDATIRFQVLDKGYITDKEFKKLSKTYRDILTYVESNEDDFHIKLLK
ncbi:MAG: heavy metal-associated domain-containing protein [Bacteroidota bacterium]|jgi:copper chaperone CopZ